MVNNLCYLFIHLHSTLQRSNFGNKGECFAAFTYPQYNTIKYAPTPKLSPRFRWKRETKARPPPQTTISCSSNPESQPMWACSTYNYYKHNRRPGTCFRYQEYEIKCQRDFSETTHKIVVYRDKSSSPRTSNR